MPRRGAARRSGRSSTKEESMKKRERQDHGKELNKKPSNLFGKLPFPEDLDLSVIGKVNETEQDEELGNSFVPPLHSTALYSESYEVCSSAKTPNSSIVSLPSGKKATRSVEVTENHLKEEEESLIRKVKKVSRKSKPVIDDIDSESISGRVTHLVKRMRRPEDSTSSAVHSANLPEKPLPSNEPLPVVKASVGTESKTKIPRRQGTSRAKRKNSQIEPLNSDKKKRSTRDGAKLDTILSAFEETLTEYKQQVASRICQKAIDNFYSLFKEQLIRILTDVQELNNLKRKNAEVITKTNKKRRLLFDAQEEQIRTEPQLKHLQTKYEELKERRSSLREATWFLSSLKQLHHDYATLKRKTPTEREKYDLSSLPALLMEARNISGAAYHLRKINCHLQQLIDHK